MSAAETGTDTPWQVEVREWMHTTGRASQLRIERTPNAWGLVDAQGNPIDLRYSLEILERIVAAVNAEAGLRAMLDCGQDDEMSCAVRAQGSCWKHQCRSIVALARLEQTWRENAEQLKVVARPGNYESGWKFMLEECADELAALRARGETSGERE